jgi:hypothetical protein
MKQIDGILGESFEWIPGLRFFGASVESRVRSAIFARDDDLAGRREFELPHGLTEREIETSWSRSYLDDRSRSEDVNQPERERDVARSGVPREGVLRSPN